MCLVALFWHQHPVYPLVLAGNRDELHDRPATPADFWPDSPCVLGGRDELAGGSWLAVSRKGRFAVVTNHRDYRRAPPDHAPSRGALVRAFVAGDASPDAFVAELMKTAEQYAGFNLLLGDASSLWYASNRAPARALGPGRYGLSNGVLDEPWPKTVFLRDRVGSALASEVLDEARIFEALGDRRVYPDEMLPDTGAGIFRERFLSAAHLVSPIYGTRAATLVTQSREGEMRFVERTFLPNGEIAAEKRYQLPLHSAPSTAPTSETSHS